MTYIKLDLKIAGFPELPECKDRITEPEQINGACPHTEIDYKGAPCYTSCRAVLNADECPLRKKLIPVTSKRAGKAKWGKD